MYYRDPRSIRKKSSSPAYPGEFIWTAVGLAIGPPQVRRNPAGNRDNSNRFAGCLDMAECRLERIKSAVITWFIVGVGLVILSSCASKNSIPLTFQSDEYVIHRLQKGESAGVLAKRFLGDRKLSWVIEDANVGTDFKRNEIVVIPLKEKNIVGVTAEGFQVVPILSYHHFADDCDSPLCIPASEFDLQMKYLHDHGYRVVSLRDLLGFFNYLHPLPERSVVITIDDGYRSVYDIAYPILKKYGFTATLFIYTDYVGVSRNAISWDQLREIMTAGFEVGSHTLSHVDLTKILEGEDDQDYLARIERELFESKEILDKELTDNTISVAFPFGRYDPRVLAICERLGYKIGVSVKIGSNLFSSDPLALRRNQVLGSGLKAFIPKLKTFERF